MLDRRTVEGLRRSPKRAAFFCGALASLADALAARGSRLIVRRGPARITVRRLAREAGVDVVVWSAGYDAQTAEGDRDLQRALEEQGLRVIVVHDAPAVAPEETMAVRSGDGDGYRSFAPYLAAWSASSHEPISAKVSFLHTTVESEALPAPAEFACDEPPSASASERVAHQKLDSFLRAPALAYWTNRNVPAFPTSGLCAHLSFGTISARTVLSRTAQRAADPFLLAEERRSLDAFRHALARRDFFLQLAWFYPETSDQPLQERMRGFRFARTHRALGAWLAGQTGYPLVDAGMRELLSTGTMHPRVRAVAASFLCFDLGIDWRIGRAAWDGLLVEDEPALAAGNWQWIAGVGADLAQYPRIYNPRKQARRWDPGGAYVRRWIPELAGLPQAEVLEPDRAVQRTQLSLELFGPGSYPAPVVDHDAVAREFLKRYTAWRSSGQR